jgi:hypothetical protein
MKTDFKVYKRKIYVWAKMTPKTAPHLTWAFAWCTNAYPTCKTAVAGARQQYPNMEFKARFSAKD